MKYAPAYCVFVRVSMCMRVFGEEEAKAWRLCAMLQTMECISDIEDIEYTELDNGIIVLRTYIVVEL